MDPVLFLHNADVHRRFCFSNQLFCYTSHLAQMEQSSNFLGNVELGTVWLLLFSKTTTEINSDSDVMYIVNISLRLVKTDNNQPAEYFLYTFLSLSPDPFETHNTAKVNNTNKCK